MKLYKQNKVIFSLHWCIRKFIFTNDYDGVYELNINFANKHAVKFTLIFV